MKKTNDHSEKIGIVIRKFDEEQLGQELAELISEKGLDTYNDGYVGFFSRGDAIAAIGGGIGAFFWFPSYFELYQFLANYFVVLAPGRYDLDHGKVFHEVAQVVKELAGGKINKETAILKINKAAQHFSQIEWIGEMNDLTCGSSEFAKELREYFYESKENSDQGIIKKEDLKEFIKKIGEYGI
jgi:hypothetical protein